MCSQVDSVFWGKGRLETFKNWPFQSSDNICNPKQMAAAGFIAIGGSIEPDLVECFVCFKQLDGWDPNDDPWDEHINHMPSCPYVHLNKQDELSWTIEELHRLLKEYYARQRMRNIKNLVEVTHKNVVKMAKHISKSYKTSQEINE